MNIRLGMDLSHYSTCMRHFQSTVLGQLWQRWSVALAVRLETASLWKQNGTERDAINELCTRSVTHLNDTQCYKGQLLNVSFHNRLFFVKRMCKRLKGLVLATYGDMAIFVSAKASFNSNEFLMWIEIYYQ